MSSPANAGARLTTRVAARTVHDLNNIAAVLSGHIYLIRGGGEPPEEGFEAIEKALENLKSLTAALRLLAGLGVEARETVDVNELVRSAVESAAGGRSIAIDLDPELREIPARRGDVQRAVEALITNAAEATASGQPLRVSTRQESDGTVSIQVEDSGGGVPEEIRRRNFDPLFTTKGVKGRGMGVTVAATVAALEEGSLEIAGRPGGGTIASLRLGS